MPGAHNEQQETGRHFSRRTFLKLGGIGVAGAVLAGVTDSVIGEHMWPSTETTLEQYRPFSKDEYRVPWLVAAALGIQSGRYISQELATIGINSAYFNLPDQNASVAGMVGAASSVYERADMVNIVGVSMGAPALLELAYQAAGQGLARSLSNVVLISAPFDIGDTRFSPVPQALSALRKLGYSGGPVGHTLYRLGVDLHQGRYTSLQDEVGRIDYEIRDGNPLSVTLSEFTMLSGANIGEHAQEYAEQGVITHSTNFYYVRPTHAATDGVVAIDNAQSKYKDFAEQCGAVFHEVQVDGLQHADIWSAVPVLQNYIHGS